MMHTVQVMTLNYATVGHKWVTCKKNPKTWPKRKRNRALMWENIKCRVSLNMVEGLLWQEPCGSLFHSKNPGIEPNSSPHLHKLFFPPRFSLGLLSAFRSHKWALILHTSYSSRMQPPCSILSFTSKWNLLII